MVGLVKIQKRCQKWVIHAKISRKSCITQLSMSICFQVTFPIWPPAAILDLGFSQILPPFSRGSWGLIFSKYFKQLKSSVKPYYALSGHGTPRLHPTIWVICHPSFSLIPPQAICQAVFCLLYTGYCWCCCSHYCCCYCYPRLLSLSKQTPCDHPQVCLSTCAITCVNGITGNNSRLNHQHLVNTCT